MARRERDPVLHGSLEPALGWAPGENNKASLHGILVDASARADGPAGSVEQLIGDHYAACVNETEIDKLGTKPAAARKAAGNVFAFEHPLAEASFDNVELRNPALQHHQTTFADLGKLAPHFDWARYFNALKLPRSDLNVTQPKFLEEFDKRLREASLAEWKTYLCWHFVKAVADVLAKPVVEENFAFNGKFLTGATEMKLRATRCAENTDALPGEALGRPWRRQTRVPGLTEIARRRGNGADHRRIYAGAAVLCGLGPVARRRHPAGDSAPDIAGR